MYVATIQWLSSFKAQRDVPCLSMSVNPGFLVCLFQILTDEDFKKIRLREIAKQIDPKVGKKRKRGADNTGPAERFVLQSVITKNFSLQISMGRI